jgi:ADP-dependent NAD(P)H-hydrate dehydratase / NAD(P)H-hydrate epimerase
MTVRVVTAAQSAARDAAAIAAGTESSALMERAGKAAADLILARFAERVASGVAIFAGPGNNGGDAWVVARHLAAAGVVVRVHEAAEARSADAVRARSAALAEVSLGAPTGNEALVVDGLLGTGARGAPTGSILDAVSAMVALRQSGATIVALDMPTGVDASTGQATSPLVADLTVTFGTIKRGHLVARGRCGAIAVVDIGLGPHADLEDGAPTLVDEDWVAARVPPIPAESHKGLRRRIVIIGGAPGMAGATVLAARAALRSGVGMVRLAVNEASLSAVQAAVPDATAVTWPFGGGALHRAIRDYAHSVLIGPGLGNTGEGRHVVEEVLSEWNGPAVLDADALNVFAGDVGSLARLLAGRPSILTPHAAELARLLDTTPDDVLARRFDAAKDLARTLGAVVLLKGVPTVVLAPNGDTLVSAAGSPVLAAAGSGDVLGGVVATVLAQHADPFASAVIAAWVHGRAGEVANLGRVVRGVTLNDVLHALSSVWRFDGPRPRPPILLELPRVGDVA